MNNLISEKNCTGCGACKNICPKDAISMDMDKYGFYKPHINQDQCIQCNLCQKICPLNKLCSKNFIEPKAYAFQIDNQETLYKCASGGAFAYFAKEIIKQNGVVYGVAYDENFVVCHIRTDNLLDLEKMYSSKYVQSDTRYTYRLALKDLKNGKIVLFSGTPCQIAGLKSYLQKDYENLITVDLICHGVPSPLVFEKYKKEFLTKLPKAEKFLNINFRSKIKGWNPQHITSTTTTASTTHARHDDFMRAFLSNLSINFSCLDCQFNKLPRIADITIGDFWGVDKYNKCLNNEKGLSIILSNTTLGQNLINGIHKTCLLVEIPLEYAIKYNKNICGSSIAHNKRTNFLNDISNGISLKKCVKKYDKNHCIYIKIYRMFPNRLQELIKFLIRRRNND